GPRSAATPPRTASADEVRAAAHRLRRLLRSAERRAPAMTTTWRPPSDGPGRSAGGTGLVHGVLHCNINTGDVSAAYNFYAGLLGLNRRMRSHSADADGTALGIDGTTDTDTWFLYDWRGARGGAAP